MLGEIYIEKGDIKGYIEYLLTIHKEEQQYYSLSAVISMMYIALEDYENVMSSKAHNILRRIAEDETGNMLVALGAQLDKF